MMNQKRQYDVHKEIETGRQQRAVRDNYLQMLAEHTDPVAREVARRELASGTLTWRNKEEALDTV